MQGNEQPEKKNSDWSNHHCWFNSHQQTHHCWNRWMDDPETYLLSSEALDNQRSLNWLATMIISYCQGIGIDPGHHSFNFGGFSSYLCELSWIPATLGWSTKQKKKWSHNNALTNHVLILLWYLIFVHILTLQPPFSILWICLSNLVWLIRFGKIQGYLLSGL